MFKLISFALQIFALKKTFTNSNSAIEFFERSVQTARNYFLFTIGCIVASVFLLIALVVAIIGIGLQIEHSGAISFTGLMISAAIFFAISLFFYFISVIALVVQRQKQLERQRAAEHARTSETGVATLLEEILKQILKNLAKPKDSNSAHQQNNQEKK